MSITTAMYDFVNFHGQSQVAINLKYFHWNCGLMRQVLAFELSPPFPGIKACPLHYIEFARYWRLLLLIEFVFYKKRRKHLKIKWFIRGFTFDAKNEYFSLSLSFICQKSEWKLFTKLMIISTSLKTCAVAKTFIEKWGGHRFCILLSLLLTSPLIIIFLKVWDAPNREMKELLSPYFSK